MQTYKLYNGVEFPVVGYGTYKAVNGTNNQAIREALRAGYRYFDSASFYGTEEGLGRAIKEEGVERSEVCLATKVWKAEMGYQKTLEAFENSLTRLDTDYIDLYLIHWPRPDLQCDWKEISIETWKAMEELYKNGRARAIGVCNFLPHHLENIMSQMEIKPMVNQLEFHLGYTQEAAVAFCKKNDICVQAWSPISRGRIFEEELLKEMVEKYNVSPAQLSLRFCIQKGMAPLPKSENEQRIKENIDVFSFEITREDMYRLESIPQTGWSGEHPDRERVKV